MSEEQSGTPTESAEHVSLGDNGVIMLSPEAEAVMNGVEMPVVEEEEEAATPAAEPAATARKIKWNGQEVEVQPEQEVELLQKGYNYEQKMAALEAERAKLTSYQGLVSAIEASPDIRQKVSAALGYQQEQPVQQAMPQFDDPIEQLKWETRQETLKEVEERFFKPIQQQQQMTAHQQALNQVRQTVQADPQYAEVQAAIIQQIQAMPESIGKNLYHQLDQDPQSYIDMYKTVKERLKPNTTNLSQNTDVMPAPTKRETKAPLLEGTTRNVPDASEQQRQTAHIKELEKKVRNGDFRAAGELMELMA